MKDEIKITVVATGFDGRGRESIKSAGTDRGYKPTPFMEDESALAEADLEKAKKRSKISPLKAAQAEPARKKGPAEEEEDELGIPAFIRKKMM